MNGQWFSEHVGPDEAAGVGDASLSESTVEAVALDWLASLGWAIARLCCMVRARNRSGVEVADDHSATAEDCASPSANILFSTVHPTIASRCCASNPFARRLPPRIRLYRRNVPSTRACCR